MYKFSRGELVIGGDGIWLMVDEIRIAHVTDRRGYRGAGQFNLFDWKHNSFHDSEVTELYKNIVKLSLP